MNYTKGKWEFNRFDLTIRVKEWTHAATMGDYRGCIITDMKPALGAEGETDVEIAKRVHPEGWRQTEANALLIAAAPAMYEALKELRNDSQYPKLRPNTRELILNALAKAEGVE